MLKVIDASIIDNLGLFEGQHAFCRVPHDLRLATDNRLVADWAHLLRGKIIEVLSQTAIVIERVTWVLRGV